MLTARNSKSVITLSRDAGNEPGEKVDQVHVGFDRRNPSHPKGIAVSIRLYTTCALAVTASAVAGLLVGGFIATTDRAPAQPRITQVSQLIPASGELRSE